MKFTISRSSLLSLLQKAIPLTEKKNTNTALNMICIKVAEEKLTIISANTEMGLNQKVECPNSLPGACLVTAKNFFDIVKELPEALIEMECPDHNYLQIKCLNSFFKMVIRHPSEFPAMPEAGVVNFQKISLRSLKKMFRLTHIAVPVESSRIQLTGFHLEMRSPGIYRMIGTDMHRLSSIEDELFLGDFEGFPKSIIIPRRALAELDHLFDDSETEVEVAVSGEYLFFKKSHLEFHTKLISGSFPDYTKVIPKNFNHKFLLDREFFTSTLRRISLFTSEKHRGVKITLSDHKMTITASSVPMGEAVEVIPIEFAQSQPVEIGLNYKYLLEWLSTQNSEKIEFSIREQLDPLVFGSPEVKNHVYFIMPMKI